MFTVTLSISELLQSFDHVISIELIPFITLGIAPENVPRKLLLLTAKFGGLGMQTFSNLSRIQPSSFIYRPSASKHHKPRKHTQTIQNIKKNHKHLTSRQSKFWKVKLSQKKWRKFRENSTRLVTDLAFLFMSFSIGTGWWSI